MLNLKSNLLFIALGFILFLLSACGEPSLCEDINCENGVACLGTDIEGLNNVTSNDETLEGTRVGDGFNNTNAFLAECSETGTAAQLCRELGPDWFLPSRGEFMLMIQNLHAKGHGDFSSGNWYWVSTEYNEHEVWANTADSGESFGYYWHRGYLKRVRAACAF